MASIRKRVLKSGATTYEVRIHRAGHPDLSKSFGSLADARAWSNKTESKIDKGEKINRKAESILLSEVLSVFKAEYQPKKGGPLSPNEVLRLQMLAFDLGEYSVAALNHDVIKKYISTLLTTIIPPPPNRKVIHPLYNGGIERTYAPSTVRKFYYQLKKCIEWHALKEKYYLDPQLFKGHAIPAAWDGERDRRLEGDEEERLYAAARRGYDYQEDTVRIIAFALETAMRAQEIFLAKWSDLNFEGRTLNIPEENVKTKTFRQIPLSKKALAILTEQQASRKENSDIIFWPWPDSNHLSRQFRRICHRAKIDDLRFHDLRHEATVRFFEKGKLSDMEIMKITGHTEYSTLQRYVKFRASELAFKMD